MDAFDNEITSNGDGALLKNNTLKKELWGRDVSLSIEYDRYTGEEILNTQREALTSLVDAWSVVDASIPEVITYCKERDPEETMTLNIATISKYVTPTALYIERNETHHVVALLCEYRFDPEDGIAVVFQDETLREVVSQPEVL